MDSLASISGLATGIDFRDLVEQIIEIESGRLEYLRVGIADGQAEQAAWEEVRGLLEAIQSASSALEDGTGLNVFTTTVLGLNPGILNVSADGSAATGRHTVRVLQRAQREILGSDLYGSAIDALGLSGQFIVGGAVVDVAAQDSLQDIAARINAENVGADPSGVSASVVGSDGAYRLMLSAAETGSEGVSVLDPSGLLATLGFLDGTTGFKNRTSGGFDSDGFTDSSTAVGTLLGFAAGAPSGTVTLGSGAGAFTVALDLASLSLEGVRDAINAAAAGAGASMFATIEADGSGFRLAVTGTAAAVDDGGVLEALGVLAGGRGAVAQVVQGDVLTTDAGGTLATASTALTALYNGGMPAGAAVGDTILLQGTDHSGAAFSFTHTIQAGDTLQTLMTRLEGAEGFNGTATVEISVDGRMTVTSAVAGGSQLSLNAFAGNEAGGILDLGAFDVTAEGRSREVSNGTDALVEIDGSLITSASNDITDVIPGVTFNILGTDPANPVEVVIDRDVDAGVEAITALVDAYNALAAFTQNGVGVIGENRPALAGDSILRGMRDQINFALQANVAGAGGAFTRLGDLGIEITREGNYVLDAAVLAAALRDDPAGVEAIFSAFGSGSSSAITYVGAGSATQAGTYDVTVSQLGSAAFLDSVGFGGVYVDDGVADTLTVTDLATNAEYQIALSNGMTLTQIIDALNTELDVEKAHEVTSERTLYSDAGATTLADSSTALSDLHHGAGQSSGFVAGSVITLSGTRPDGSSVLQTFDVTDPATQTLGDVRAAMASAFGAGVTVSIVNGELVVRELDEGASALVVAVGSDVPGNAAPFGQMLVTTEGRDASGLVAEAAGSELRIRSPQYGSANGFSIGFSAGGADGTASLGLAAGSYTGTDVVGTIGGEAATGTGNLLTADGGTAADGLTVKITGATTGSLGTVTYGTGIMTNVQEIVDRYLGPDDGSIDAIIDRLRGDVDRLEDRLFDREDRLEVRKQQLLSQFVALEVAIAKSQSLSDWLTAQIGSLPSANNS